MKSIKEFPFEKVRRISQKEVDTFRKAIDIERTTGKKRLKRKGRPPKTAAEKYVPISIRLHPTAFAWLKKEAKKKDLPYQTIINQLILRAAA